MTSITGKPKASQRATTARIQEKEMATQTPIAAVKKLTRYCCNECGAKELYLYCWKGCRHIQNLKVFYTQTKEICHEVETLKATVYDQEVRLRDMESLLKEKQQNLDMLTKQIDSLPQFQSSSSSLASPTVTSACLLPTRLPPWATTAIALMIDKFDGDHDGRLSRSEVTALAHAVKQANMALELTGQMDNNNNHPQQPTTMGAEAVLAYYDRLGITQLSNHLCALGIHYGTTPSLAESVTKSLGKLSEFTRQANRLHEDVSSLQHEVNEKARATTRLREGFAEAKMALDTKDDEIQRVERKRSHVDIELVTTKDKLGSLSSEVKQLRGELTTRNTALQDFRALVEDQVMEKEKWQRYCWELEERLYESVHTSHAKERDLWKARDAKKEEERKNMLLYMERQMGKKHYYHYASEPQDMSDDPAAKHGKVVEEEEDEDDHPTASSGSHSTSGESSQPNDSNGSTSAPSSVSSVSS